MQRLHDSTGEHIANFKNGQLYSTNGENIGHWLTDKSFFIDMNGYYLGEIYKDKRLLHRTGTGYENVSFGNRGNHGNIGNYGDPGNIGSAGMPGDYWDIAKERLR